MSDRRNDKIANLPSEDRAKLDAWLGKEPYRRVLELVAAPRPEGLALKTNLRALSRYFNKFLAPNPIDELNDLALHNPKAAEAAATTLLLQQAAIATEEFEYKGFDTKKFNALLRFRLPLQQKESSQQWLDMQKQYATLRLARKI